MAFPFPKDTGREFWMKTRWQASVGGLGQIIARGEQAQGGSGEIFRQLDFAGSMLLLATERSGERHLAGYHIWRASIEQEHGLQVDMRSKELGKDADDAGISRGTRPMRVSEAIGPGASKG